MAGKVSQTAMDLASAALTSTTSQPPVNVIVDSRSEVTFVERQTDETDAGTTLSPSWLSTTWLENVAVSVTTVIPKIIDDMFGTVNENT